MDKHPIHHWVCAVSTCFLMNNLVLLDNTKRLSQSPFWVQLRPLTVTPLRSTLRFGFLPFKSSFFSFNYCMYFAEIVKTLDWPVPQILKAHVNFQQKQLQRTIKKSIKKSYILKKKQKNKTKYKSKKKIKKNNNIHKKYNKILTENQKKKLKAKLKNKIQK